MTDALTDPAGPDDPSQDVAGACAGGEETRSRERVAMLRELAEIGMFLARDLKQKAADPEADPGEVGLLFSRIARAVRQTLALEARLDDELQTRVRKAQRDLEDARQEVARAPYQRRRRQIQHAVGKAINAEAEDDDHLEQLTEELGERLYDREDDEDFLDRPVGELVALICKDLGVTCDPTLWEDEPWAIAEAAQRAQPPPDEPESPDLAFNSPASRHAPPAAVPNWLSG